VCSDCGKVHYRNPRIIVRCIADHAGAILLCRRADEPRRGYWTTPGGYLENGEALSHAAAREAHEETGVDVGELRLAFVYEMPQLNEVVMILAGRAVSDASACGPESLEVRFFPPDALPWSGLAFPTDLEALRAYRANELLPQQAQFFWGGDGRVLMRAG
jgi:ADP-ribose pyrophosphatase YjhB (NUDIX family)